MILPGGTIGILGGGQLGRMIAMAARQHGYGVVVLAPAGDAPAVGVADRAIRASFEDSDAARLLAEACDVVTYEFENVPESTVRAIEGKVAVHPHANLLGITQDRVREHDFLHALGIPTARGRPVRTATELVDALAVLGWPARLKAARGGYDGGGQWRVRGPEDIRALTAPLDGRAYLLEAEVPFEREISVIVARAADGDTKVFPIFENVHDDGILRVSSAPARVSNATAARAVEIAYAIADTAGLVGTLAVECFVAGGEVLVNELAPRVHNSGHLTVEACVVSQFEQHVRAICGLPLLEPAMRAPAAMVNLLGTEEKKRVRLAGADVALAEPEVHLHVYGKASTRARRKMGHVTALGNTVEEALQRAHVAAGALRFV
ncbi:MAG: 5-(carboxyamino)imidazole ribonucleotide synthase [Myxococcota bacterium]